MTFEQFEAGVERTRELLRNGSAINHLVRMTARESRPCRDCGHMIHFVPCKDGSLQPFDSDGQSHYVTCPKASAHRERIGPMAVRRPNNCPRCGGMLIDRDWRLHKDDGSRRCTCDAVTAAPTLPTPAARQEGLFGDEPTERYPD